MTYQSVLSVDHVNRTLMSFLCHRSSGGSRLKDFVAPVFFNCTAV